MARRVELAQVNIALACEPLDAPLLADFMAALAQVNARADRAPGFVWRMQSAGGDATGIRGFGDDPKLIINLTVWRDRDAMAAFVYEDPEHLAVMRRRREWFERLALHTVLWWVPVGHRPTVVEAEERLEHLREHGAIPHAFSFRQAFDPVRAAEATGGERWLCPA